MKILKILTTNHVRFCVTVSVRGASQKSDWLEHSTWIGKVLQRVLVDRSVGPAEQSVGPFKILMHLLTGI